MDPRFETEMRKTVSLTHGLAHIERALQVAERMGDFRYLPEVIRHEMAYAEEIAGDDLNASRRLIAGHRS